VLRHQLAQLKVEEETLGDVQSYLRVISDAHEVITWYQDTSISGRAVLNQEVWYVESRYISR
jgi:hypothetical protein